MNANISTMRDIIQQLRGHVEMLREQNGMLREELQSLKEENRSLRRSSQPGLATSQGQEDDLMRLLEELDSADYTIATPSPENRSEANWRPPTIPHQQRSPQTQLPQQRGPSSDDFDIYMQKQHRFGKALSPEASTRLGVEPRQSGPRPNMDIGYVNSVSPEELDQLPYGLIVVDAQGNVLFYNETESSLTGFARERIIGKNFFTRVAPCAQVKEFEGRFHDFVDGKLGRVTSFDFAFHFEKGTQNVVIVLSHGRKRGHFNIMLVRH